MKLLWVVMMLTFMSGFASGVYVFAVTRDSASSLLPAAATDTTRGFSITYDAYGACRTAGCVSYRVESGGVAVVSVTRQGRVVSRSEAKLSEELQAQVVETLKQTRFAAVQSRTCTAVTAGTYARVSVRLGADTYTYDTCTVALPEPLRAFVTDYQSWLGI